MTTRRPRPISFERTRRAHSLPSRHRRRPRGGVPARPGHRPPHASRTSSRRWTRPAPPRSSSPSSRRTRHRPPARCGSGSARAAAGAKPPGHGPSTSASPAFPSTIVRATGRLRRAPSRSARSSTVSRRRPGRPLRLPPTRLRRLVGRGPGLARLQHASSTFRAGRRRRFSGSSEALWRSTRRLRPPRLPRVQRRPSRPGNRVRDLHPRRPWPPDERLRLPAAGASSSRSWTGSGRRRIPRVVAGTLAEVRSF